VRSAHIVVHNGRTCSDPAVLGRAGRIYRGTVGPLSTQANRRVWTVLVRVIHAAVSLTAH